MFAARFGCYHDFQRLVGRARGLSHWLVLSAALTSACEGAQDALDPSQGIPNSGTTSSDPIGTGIDSMTEHGATGDGHSNNHGTNSSGASTTVSSNSGSEGETVTASDSAATATTAEETTTIDESVVTDSVTDSITEDDSQSTGDDGTTDTTPNTGTCTGVCGTPGCGECPVDELVSVGEFSIDPTEVTYRQYKLFVSSGYSITDQPAQCAWNSSFVPAAGWPAPSSKTDYPVVYVNWCQARAFCEWRGARLCGKIGGGANDYSSFKTVAKSQWYYACSHGGTYEYPYGDGAYDPTACNGKEYGIRRPLPVPAVATCESPYTGIFDLSGNAYEWSDECEIGEGRSDLCRRRGGSFYSEATLLRCQNGSSRARDHVDDYTGFRCCKDAP